MEDKPEKGYQHLDKPKSTRLFAAFRNKEHLEEMREMLYNNIPDVLHFDLTVFIGQLESTILEGFSDETDE